MLAGLQRLAQMPWSLARTPSQARVHSDALKMLRSPAETTEDTTNGRALAKGESITSTQPLRKRGPDAN